MSGLVDNQGRVVLTLGLLETLACPRRAFWLARCEDSEFLAAQAVRAACASTLGTLATAGWPANAFDRLPALVARALLARWRFRGGATSDYHRAVAGLTTTLRRFLRLWQPPSGLRWQLEPNARWEDWREPLLLRGGLLLALSTATDAAGPGIVYDFRIGGLSWPGEVPLVTVGLAALAQARLGLQCALEVRSVDIGTGEERRWLCGRAQLAQEWRRLQHLAAELHADRWPAAAGPRCHECPVGNCEAARPAASAALPRLVATA